MTQVPFSKPATTYAQQIDMLKQRGMQIDDSAEAEFYLQHLNYYRLGAYWLPFESDHSRHVFRPGTHFQDVLNLYIFDRELRLLVMDAIERFEVSVRAQWCYQLAHYHGPHAPLDASLARNHDLWRSITDSLKEEVSRSQEIFIQHLLMVYEEPLPPIWALCEIMSLGVLSKCYKNLKPKATRRAISKTYGIDEEVLQSWLHHLVTVRNLCAHHSRLWNREFTFTPQAPRSKPAKLIGEFRPGSRKIYNTFVLLLHCMDCIAPDHSLRQRLKELIQKHQIPVSAMGFPADWENRRIWKGF